MIQLFGDSSDSRASLAGHRRSNSESPLHDFALGVRAAYGPVSFVRPAAAPTFALTHGVRSAVAPDGDFDLAKPSACGCFKQPSVLVADGAGRTAFCLTRRRARLAAGDVYGGGLSAGRAGHGRVAAIGRGLIHTGAPRFVRFAASLSLAFDNAAAPAGATGSSTLVPAPVHLGPLQFTTRLESASLAAPALSMNDNAYGAGANFDVRAGARNLNVDLSRLRTLDAQRHERVSSPASARLRGSSPAQTFRWSCRTMPT